METVRPQPGERTRGGDAAALRGAGRGDDAEERRAAVATVSHSRGLGAARVGWTRWWVVERLEMARSAEPDAERRGTRGDEAMFLDILCPAGPGGLSDVPTRRPSRQRGCRQLFVRPARSWIIGWGIDGRWHTGGRVLY